MAFHKLEWLTGVQLRKSYHVLNLPDILRLLWVRRIVSRDEVRELITKMEQVENLILTEAQRTEIYAPHRRSS